MLEPYIYRFVQNNYPKNNGRIKNIRLYSFRSEKTNDVYLVWVECYNLEVFAIKFPLKSHSNSKKKYSLMTNKGDARRVIHTCMQILWDIAKVNERSSFGFIGSNNEDEPKKLTKRFKLYRRIVLSFFSENSFIHQINEDYSTYLLIRRSELERNPFLKNQIEEFFTNEYDFDN